MAPVHSRQRQQRGGTGEMMMTTRMVVVFVVAILLPTRMAVVFVVVILLLSTSTALCHANEVHVRSSTSLTLMFQVRVTPSLMLQ
jgi:hypothetical protein